MAETPRPTKKTTPPAQGKWGWIFAQILFISLLLWAWQQMATTAGQRTIPYSEFKTLVSKKEVIRAAISETEITGRAKGEPPPLPQRENALIPAPPQAPATVAEAPQPPPAGAKPNPSGAAAGEANAEEKSWTFRTARVNDPQLVEQLQAAGVDFSGRTPGLMEQILGSWILPLGLIILFWLWMSRSMGGAAGQAILGIGKSKARVLVDKDTGVSFRDVAGCDEAKFELEEVVDFLKHPARYLALGARIPKGAILIGPPGTGKTLLARAVAGEAKVPFFSISGSEFVEMFVGVGAARVRDLFEQAKAQAPCIIFIDELDAIGRQRGIHMGGSGGHDEREQTLNQLLVELDGFDPNVGIIILAATNRPEILDRALLRPGRFDRQIIVDSPDLDGREEILKVHSANKPLAPDVNLRDVARATPGFSGADLSNTLNEAALLAARHDGKTIAQHDLEEALEKVIAGPERRSRRLTDDEKRRVAYHETGHAIVAAYCKNADPVRKISIIPRGRAALGFTMQLPTEQQFLMTSEGILDRIRGLLGGRAAEELIFHEASTGAENDLERATALARQMVCVYGMNDKAGLARTVHADPSPTMNPMDINFIRDCSEETAQMIDREVKRILDTCYAQSSALLETHRAEMEMVATRLIKEETLDGPTFYGMIHRPAPAGAEIPG